MLVLTRKLDEQIRIGQDVTITIVKLRGNTVRIGIEAPRGVDVRRGELPAAKETSQEVWLEPENRLPVRHSTGLPVRECVALRMRRPR